MTDEELYDQMLYEDMLKEQKQSNAPAPQQQATQQGFSREDASRNLIPSLTSLPERVVDRTVSSIKSAYNNPAGVWEGLKQAGSSFADEMTTGVLPTGGRALGSALHDVVHGKPINTQGPIKEFGRKLESTQNRLGKSLSDDPAMTMFDLSQIAAMGPGKFATGLAAMDPINVAVTPAGIVGEHMARKAAGSKVDNLRTLREALDINPKSTNRSLQGAVDIAETIAKNKLDPTRYDSPDKLQRLIKNKGAEKGSILDAIDEADVRIDVSDTGDLINKVQSKYQAPSRTELQRAAGLQQVDNVKKGWDDMRPVQTTDNRVTLADQLLTPPGAPVPKLYEGDIVPKSFRETDLSANEVDILKRKAQEDADYSSSNEIQEKVSANLYKKMGANFRQKLEDADALVASSQGRTPSLARVNKEYSALRDAEFPLDSAISKFTKDGLTSGFRPLLYGGLTASGHPLAAIGAITASKLLGKDNKALRAIKRYNRKDKDLAGVLGRKARAYTIADFIARASEDAGDQEIDLETLVNFSN